MNEILNDILYGPLGWKIACMVLTLVGIILAVALMDGPWSRGKETANRSPPQQNLDDPPADVSSGFKQENQEDRTSASKLSE